jgi:histidinol phosphatase-like PHP family hydrolase
VEIDGSTVRVEEHSLAMPEEYGLVDTHVHTPLAYCGENLDMRRTGDLAKALGLGGMFFTEHSGHLYFDAAGYGRCAENGLTAARPRLRRTSTYFGLLQAHGIPAERWGMEVDAGWDGSALIAPEDNRRLAFRIGAMHSLRSLTGPDRNPVAAEAEFMAVLERFLRHGFHSLAHPFRVFRRANVPTPTALFLPVARLLREHNTAAEINFHTNEPAAEFVRICLELGVKITFGSDAHNLYEIGDFHPHMALLQEAGFTGNPRDILLAHPVAG